MSEEEKKAIEWLKNANFFSARIYAPVLLSLIEKQEKEIESLKKGNKSLMDSRKKWKDRYYKQRYIDYKQEKEIEELKKPKYLYNANTGEITRIENEKGIDKNKIEELSAEIEELKKENFDTVYIQAIENYKAKIREKIKELEESKEKYFEKQIIQGRIDILNELLEE